MSFDQCLTNAEKEGVLTRQEAMAFRSQYRALAAQLSATLGPQAPRQAARQVFNAFAASAMRKRRNKLKQAQIAKQLGAAQDAYVAQGGQTSPGLFMINLIEDIIGRAGQSTVYGRYRAVVGEAHAMLAQPILAFERDAAGRTRGRALLDAMTRELFGENTGDATARAFAAAWTNASEMLRQRFNAAGGAIAKLDKWGLPQTHDAIAVATAGVDEWIAFVTPKLDRARMIDMETGLPLAAERLDALLRETYEAITTRGLSKLDPSGQPLGRSLANSRLDSRFLRFAAPADWIAYQQRFGQGDAFAAMMAHIDEMARDIAQMEILGPNPAATMRFLDQNARKIAAENAGDGTGARAVNGQVQTAHKMLALFDGSANVPENAGVAAFAAGLREFLVSAQLGMASISSVTDFKTQRLARRIAGIRSNAVIFETLKMLDPSDPDVRRIAITSGLVADGASQVGLAYARFAGEFNARGLTRWLADTTLRWSGLSPLTQAHKWAFGMEFMAAAASHAQKPLAALDAGDAAEKAFAATLRNFQLDARWDAIRQARGFSPRAGATFLTADDIARDVGQAEALRWREMVGGMTRIAIPEAMLRARAALHGGAPGSFTGEFSRSLGAYKSYPAAVSMILHSVALDNALRAGGGLNGARSASMFVATTIAGLTVYGAIAMQMKELAKGRDPRDMTDAKFWGQALAQGGGLGIFGDFLSASTSRGGQNFEQTLAGAPAGFLADASGLTIGNAAQALAGERTNATREGFDFARRYTPVLSSTWYLSGAYQRGVLDNLQRLADPEADQYFRRKDRDQRRQYGNGYYWAPGETLPSRAPALETAIGAESPQ